MPGPSSSTVSSPSASRTVTTPSGGLHLAALSSRLVTARSSAGGVADDRPRLDVGLERRRRGRGGGPGRAPGRRRRRGRTVATTVGHRVVARELDQVADQRGELLDLGADVVEQLDPRLARAGRGPACASRSRLVRSEVSGVRSSCPASATSWRCRSRDAASAIEHRVEGAGQPGDLVVALDRQRPQVLGLGRSPRRRAVSRRTGRSPLRATAQPGRRGGDHAGEPEEQHHQRRAWRASAAATPATARAPAPGPAPAGGHGHDPVALAVLGDQGAHALRRRRRSRRRARAGRARAAGKSSNVR